jgi:hypothetical protein
MGRCPAASHAVCSSSGEENGRGQLGALSHGGESDKGGRQR